MQILNQTFRRVDYSPRVDQSATRLTASWFVGESSGYGGQRLRCLALNLMMIAVAQCCECSVVVGDFRQYFERDGRPGSGRLPRQAPACQLRQVTDRRWPRRADQWRTARHSARRSFLNILQPMPYASTLVYCVAGEAVWQLQPKVVQTVQRHLSRMNLSGYIGRVTVFNWMFTIAWCIVSSTVRVRTGVRKCLVG